MQAWLGRSPGVRQGYEILDPLRMEADTRTSPGTHNFLCVTTERGTAQLLRV
jgi:hypothetical protein